MLYTVMTAPAALTRPPTTFLSWQRPGGQAGRTRTSRRPQLVRGVDHRPRRDRNRASRRGHDLVRTPCDPFQRIASFAVSISRSKPDATHMENDRRTWRPGVPERQPARFQAVHLSRDQFAETQAARSDGGAAGAEQPGDRLLGLPTVPGEPFARFDSRARVAWDEPAFAQPGEGFGEPLADDRSRRAGTVNMARSRRVVHWSWPHASGTERIPAINQGPYPPAPCGARSACGAAFPHNRWRLAVTRSPAVFVFRSTLTHTVTGVFPTAVQPGDRMSMDVRKRPARLRRGGST